MNVTLLQVLALLLTSCLAAGNEDIGSLRGADHTLDEDGRYLVETSPVITLVESTDDSHTVKVQQTVIGDINDCEGSAKAPFMFTIYKSGHDMQEKCDYWRDATACHEQVITLPCDPVTHTATIDVYIVLDRSGTLKGKDTITNPNVGWCFPQDREIIPRSVKYTETFQCKDPNAPAPKSLEEEFPSNCVSAQKYAMSVSVGTFTIWKHDADGPGNHKPMTIFCYREQEYITLQDPDANYSQYMPYGPKWGPALTTKFSKSRIDINTLKVDVASYDFSTTTRTADCFSSSCGRVPYGSAVSCLRPRTMRASIDLRGTGFKVADVTDFTILGLKTSSRISAKPGGQQLIMRNNRNCGFITLGQHEGYSKNLYPQSYGPGTYTLQLALV